MIRALYDYEAQAPQELSFTKGDFFHVISREDSEDWYEACNPMLPDARGLVPAQYFEKLGKSQQRDSSKSEKSNGSKEPAHDSGFAESMTLKSPGQSPQKGPITRTTSLATARMSNSGKRAMGSVLARLDHPFEADTSRPEHDEISREVGEMVLIVAVSTAEWVVAKPAGPKGGGHGLLPLGFVTLLDMRTHQPLQGDPLEIIAREMVPQVDVWKQATAAYKNSCIELGKIGSNVTPQLQQQQADLQQSIERMSLQQQAQQNAMRTSGQMVCSCCITDMRLALTCAQLAYREAEMAERAKPPHGPMYYKDPGQEEAEERTKRYPLRLQMQNYARLFSPPSSACIYARVSQVQYEPENHVFILNVAFEDGNEYELWRTYENFFKFQVLLKDGFPGEAGDLANSSRTLPFMPGPLPQGESLTEAISIKRRDNLDSYVQKLLEQPPKVSRSMLVTTFFSPQNNFDRFLTKNSQSTNGYAQQNQRTSHGNHGMSDSRQSSQTNLNGGYSGNQGAHKPQNGFGHNTGDYQSDSRQNSTFSQQPSNNSQQEIVTQPQQSSAMKVKIYYGDDLFAIRVPADVQFSNLYEKICDRCKIADGEEVELSYKDEPSGEKPLLLSNNDLDFALNRNDKLIIYVSQRK